jgi:cob(I)alamin adenosyltransferase
MSIYTRTGDQGETDLLGGARVPKDALRPEVCGTLDELNALLGLARSYPLSESVQSLAGRLQSDLFRVAAEVAAADPGALAAARIGPADVAALERAIDQCEAQLPPLRSFILPGGGQPAGVLHLARAVCRRAERRLVTLARSEPAAVSADLLAYVNRLSDLLFVLARMVNSQAGVAETIWPHHRLPG